ncbi:hypothetical protein BU23DRAFT_663383 [Bimuria novae-zelandiae CBS 107.79]|uniref:VOC domain-containing protein n=1 Tax=Bimuria novae-zelandiae CBS 107.79 TaxID=1447943 RepID=A0A6A5URB7_9PLEO|nr:hypothetical protein BU23DRAFT_663383 [Bimuria novae-zelandiae CBS 107.79]
MVSYYRVFLGAKVVHENSMLAFLSYDDEHHRIAIEALPSVKDKQQKHNRGLEHIAFTFNTLSDLLLAYRQRKQHNILSLWSVNHGPTTLIYYEDPDGNQLETQVDNFANPDDATVFMESKEFMENPIGVDFDPEEFIERLRQGEDERVLCKRLAIRPRGLPEHMR